MGKLFGLRKKKADKKLLKQGKVRLGDGSIFDLDNAEPGEFLGRWNGELCVCRCVEAKILQPGKEEMEEEKRLWYLPFVGEVWQMIEVEYYGTKYYISNDDGSGFTKITLGQGRADFYHARFDSVEIESVITDFKKVIQKPNFEKFQEIKNKVDEHFGQKEESEKGKM